MTMDKPVALSMVAGNMGRSTHKRNLFSCAASFGLERRAAETIFDDIVECILDNWDSLAQETEMKNETWLSPIISYWRSKRGAR